MVKVKVLLNGITIWPLPANTTGYSREVNQKFLPAERGLLTSVYNAALANREYQPGFFECHHKQGKGARFNSSYWTLLLMSAWYFRTQCLFGCVTHMRTAIYGVCAKTA